MNKKAIMYEAAIRIVLAIIAVTAAIYIGASFFIPP